MKKKNKNFIIPYQLFPFDVMVSIAETDAQLIRKLKRHLPANNHDQMDIAMLAPTGQGKCAMFCCGATVIRLKHHPDNPSTQGHLAHEIFHAVEFLMEGIGIKYSIDCGEIFAYTIEYLTKKIYEKLP